MPTIRIAEPTAEPVTLAEAKAACRVDHNLDDLMIGGLIVAARQLAEGELKRPLLETGFELRTDAFAPALRLDYPRATAVQSVKFVDPQGTLRLLDPQDYVLDNASDVGPGWLVPARNREWPETSREVNAVRVRYLAGYGRDASRVPQAIRQWMLMHIRAMYDSPSAVSAGKMEALPYLCGLIEPYRVYG